MVTAVSAIEVDRPERSVVLEVGRRVGERILAAQFGLNLVKAISHLLDRRREQHLTASLFGHFRKNLVALAAAWCPVGADGVDDRLSALAHLDCFVDSHTTLVVIAV